MRHTPVRVSSSVNHPFCPRAAPKEGIGQDLRRRSPPVGAPTAAGARHPAALVNPLSSSRRPLRGHRPIPRTPPPAPDHRSSATPPRGGWWRTPRRGRSPTIASITRPRSWVIRKSLPSRSLAATAPRQTIRSGIDPGDLGVQPRTAGLDVAHLGCLVDPALAAELESEVLDRVRHVDVGTIHPGLVQCLLEQSAGRSHERDALPVLDVARLLADQHQPGPVVAGREDDLGRRFPQLTAPTLRRRGPQSGDIGSLRYPFGSTHPVSFAPTSDTSTSQPASRPRLSFAG